MNDYNFATNLIHYSVTKHLHLFCCMYIKHPYVLVYICQTKLGMLIVFQISDYLLISNHIHILNITLI